MKKFLTYIVLLGTVFAGAAKAADEMDDMLFGPAPKITAGNKIITPSPTPEGKLLEPVAMPEDSDEFDNVEEALAREKASVQSAVGTPPPPPSQKVGNNQSLTEAIKAGSAEDDEDAADDESASPLAGTWVEKLAQKALSKSENEGEDGEHRQNIGVGNGANLENMLASTQKGGARRSNASVFDISGAMLRMSRSQVDAVMLKRGFKLASQKFEIPNFIKWRYEEDCRNAGVIGYERLAACVVKAAKANNHQYVESEKFVKYDSKEEININFTSNFTNNKVYKITYQSMMPRKNSGSGAKSRYLRDIKVYDFWRKINQKYGVPDNKEDVMWGMGGNKPYMKAATGYLCLEDPMLRELDYTRMSREDQRFMNTNTYNF